MHLLLFLVLVGLIVEHEIREESRRRSRRRRTARHTTASLSDVPAKASTGATTRPSLRLDRLTTALGLVEPPFAYVVRQAASAYGVEIPAQVVSATGLISQMTASLPSVATTGDVK